MVPNSSTVTAAGQGEYRADLWQVAADKLGHQSIYETNEDGGPGDLVAQVYGDRAALIAATPELLEELEQQADGCSAIIGLLKGQGAPVFAVLSGMLSMQEQAARAVIAKAKGGAA